MTEECLLDPSRNPHLGKEGIEQMLKDYLGIKKVRGLALGWACMGQGASRRVHGIGPGSRCAASGPPAEAHPFPRALFR